MSVQIGKKCVLEGKKLNNYNSRHNQAKLLNFRYKDPAIWAFKEEKLVAKMKKSL